MQAIRTIAVAATILTAFLVAGVLVAQSKAGRKPTRALPPKWGERVEDVYFENALEKLVGERPVFGTGATRPTTVVPGGEEQPPNEGGVFAWSNWIGPEIVEDEIKQQQQLINESVTTPSNFKGGGYRDARRQLSAIAVMFAIAGEYDKQVRWKDDAPGLRDLFARAGFNTKVGTDQSFNEARLRKQDLADLIRGDRPASIKDAEAKANWAKVAGRPPIMQRMEQAFQKRLTPALASKGEFSNRSEEVYHEAQVLAALAEIITREGFEYWDDEDYAGYARQVRDGAKEIVDAVKSNDYDKARAGAAEITKGCADCHDGYRA